MLLEPQDVELFFKLHRALMFFVNQRLKVILRATPPIPVQLAAVYPHKKLQDPKVRLLLDFMAERCQRLIRDALAGK